MFNLIKSKWIQIGASLVITIYILFSLFFNVPIASPLISKLEDFLYDNMIGLFLHKESRQVRVVIIDIDEQSIQAEGRWPWHRDKLALLLQKLKDAGVVVTAFDIVMSEPETNYALGLQEKLSQMNIQLPEKLKNLPDILGKMAPYIDNDQALVKMLADYDVILGFLFHDIAEVKKGALPDFLTDAKGIAFDASKYTLHDFKGYNGSLGIFIKAAKSGGFVSNFGDPDGTVRYSMLLASYGNKIYPNLALKTVMRYLLADNVELVTFLRRGKLQLRGLKLDGTFIPTDTQSRVLIPFWGPPGTLDYYSASDVMEGKVGSKELEGAIAIVGSSMILLSDLHQTPVSDLFPGVEVVGNLVAGMTAQQIPSQFYWTSGTGIAALLLIGTFFALLFPLLSAFVILAVAIVAIIAIIAASILVFDLKNMYISTAAVLMIISLQATFNYLYEFILVKRQKRKISQLFGQYVPEDYVKALIEFPEGSILEGVTNDMTALFSDIRGFTSLSENLDAAGVKKLLNTFFTPITEIIFNHKGTIDKYVGDMVVAFWGAPLEDKEHALHAITASLAIFKNLPVINAKMLANNLPTVNIGIGLGTGLMNVGDMGSEFRRAYTVLGDTVNLASRLQDLTKFYQVDILVNDSSRRDQDTILWRPIDKVAVKGRGTALIIYQPICLVEETTPELNKEVDDYNQALAAYYAQDWQNAEQRFSALRSHNPVLYLYQLYLERIEEFKIQPPPPEWDGVYIHTHK